MLVLTGITSSGTADSFIKVSHVTKTRHAHQVTAASLHTLLHFTYTEYNRSATEAESALSFEQWCQVSAQQSVQFDYWLKTLLLEITMLLFIRSYVKAISNSIWSRLQQLYHGYLHLTIPTIPGGFQCIFGIWCH